jgi:peptidoglycan/LPS O-acetylase OafA/YrhL
MEPNWVFSHAGYACNTFVIFERIGPKHWKIGYMNTYPSDIKPLTGLRFIAAFWLLLYFFWDRLGLGPREQFGLIEKGGMGVDLFFILSGFILAHVYGPQVETKTFHWPTFLWARLARVYPLHLACLLAMIGIWFLARMMGAEIEAQAFNVSQIPAHIALVQAWGLVGSDGWNFPSWSISAEWFAYLTFPVTFGIAALFRKAPLFGIGLAVTLFGALVALAHLMGMVLVDMTWQGGALRIIPSFLMGIACWMLGRKITMPALQAQIGVGISVAWIMGAASLRFPTELLWPGLAGLVFFLAETSKHENYALCASKSWVYLGEISFAAYMVHLPVDIVYYQVVERVFGQPQGGLALALGSGSILLTWMVAAAAHALIENPARNFMRNHVPPFMRRTAQSASQKNAPSQSSNPPA